MKDDKQEPTGRAEMADDVAGLIRLAGRRPGVPADRSARVKAAAREQWIAQILRRRRRRLVWAAAAVAAAASLGLAISFLGRLVRPDAGPQMAATVESVQGSVGIAPFPAGSEKAERRVLKPGDLVTSPSIVTCGEDGRLALRLSRGSALRLDKGSRLRIEEADVTLEAGSVYIDSGDGGPRAGSLLMRTPLGDVREIGTQYEVRLEDGGIRVRVREGMVAFEDGRQVREIVAAGELALRKDGTVASRRIPIHGPEWDWIAQVTTVPELDGMSARAFLEWVARERGWRLRFDTEELERSAGGITLDGSLERLNLNEALDAVLPTCGLSYRVEEDALVIAGTRGTDAQDGHSRGGRR